MKTVILSVLLTLMSNTGFATDYICEGEIGEPVVEIIQVEGLPQFRYLVGGETLLSLTMNEDTIQPVTQSPIGIDAGQTFTYRPGYGETMVHIYGKIRSLGAVFDIFVLGMLGNVQETLIDYKCELQAVDQGVYTNIIWYPDAKKM